MNQLLRSAPIGVIAILCVWIVVHAVLHVGSFVEPVVSLPAPDATLDRIYVAFRNDDLSIFSDPAREDSVVRVFWRHRIAQTYAFIPNPSGYLGEGASVPPTARSMIDSLRSWRAAGWIEFALHGATHVRSPGSAGEFDGVAPDLQQTKLRDAKRMADSLLAGEVRIFAPPWNASDCATVRACNDVGLTIFSGYLGVCPGTGVTMVNSSAELFPDSSGLPSFEEALAAAREGVGERVLVAFYHSRVDFNQPGKYAYLDSLLSMLCTDPRVRCTTIGELAREAPELLAAQNAAGYTMLQADRAVALARPYARVLNGLVTVLGASPPRDPRGVGALQAYWRGENGRAAALAQERILSAALTVRLARLLTVVVTVIVVVVLVWGLRRWSLNTRVALVGALGILLPVVILSVVVLVHPFSEERISDIADMASLVAGSTGLVLALQVLRTRLRHRRADGDRGNPSRGTAQ